MAEVASLLRRGVDSLVGDGSEVNVVVVLRGTLRFMPHGRSASRPFRGFGGAFSDRSAVSSTLTKSAGQIDVISRTVACVSAKALSSTTQTAA